MKLEIISPEKYLYNGEAIGVTLPGAHGVFSVRDKHAALFSTLNTGVISVLTTENKELEFEISGGVIEVKSNVVTICVNN